MFDKQPFMRLTEDYRCIALAFRVLSSDLKFAEIIVDREAVGALIALTRSDDAPCRLRCGTCTALFGGYFCCVVVVFSSSSFFRPACLTLHAS